MGPKAIPRLHDWGSGVSHFYKPLEKGPEELVLVFTLVNKILINIFMEFRYLPPEHMLFTGNILFLPKSQC
jgi:hypothetical protein